MKQILLIILLIGFSVSSTFAGDIPNTLNTTATNVEQLNAPPTYTTLKKQAAEDTILIKKKFTEVYGYKNGQLLRYADYKELFANTPDALERIMTANSFHKVGNFFGFVGGFMFGFIGVAGLKDIESVDYTWGIALGASAAVAGVGLLIYSAGNKNQIKAINIYNANINGLKRNQPLGYLKAGFTGSGIGLVYTF